MTRVAGPVAAERCDTLVLGGGAAGLAAAQQLAHAGQAVLLLEARDRLGGRIWSRRAAGLPVPLELGAEFLHGRQAASSDWLRRAGTAAVDVPAGHWLRRDGRLRQAEDVFPRLKAALRRSRLLRGPDRSFADFLERRGNGLPEDLRRFARLLVEGFDAADPELASAQAVAGEWSGEGGADAPTFRVAGGYGVLVEALARAARAAGVRVRLRSVARELRWRRGHVTCSGLRAGRPFVVQARRAVVTLPLGVLRRAPDAPGALRFDPALPGKQHALLHLLSGPVLKLLLRFREPFWEELRRGRWRDASFFHTPQAAFPTLWTPLPVRAPLLVAWAGGPKAAQLSGLEAARIVREALRSVDQAFGRGARAAARLVAADFHDWTTDPFSRGAYSYVTVGGGAARRELAASVADTLHFAGEATSEDAAGTVQGALESGLRAARSALAGAGTRLAATTRAARRGRGRPEKAMPSRRTVQNARRDRSQGKSPSTQAGEFVREEIEDIRSGRHGARSTKQAIAIGLSKARRAGVDLPAPRKGRVSEETRRSAERDLRKGRSGSHRPSPRRSKATLGALRREGRSAASTAALSRQARQAARRRSAAERSASARRAARTRGSRTGRSRSRSSAR